jgi:hypothetical protein
MYVECLDTKNIFLTICHLTLKEFSVGTSLNKYLWAPKDNDEGMEKRDGDKRTATALWFGPRLGKR